jgi:hypothetical protein
MPLQTSKKTTLSGNSFKLDTLDPNNYYDATLSGSNQSAASHSTLIPASLTNLRGDSLTATSSGSTLYGGAGRDSLTGLGANESLISGTGIDTLVSKGNAATLVGNGLSSLSSTAANAFFLLGTASGDSIGSAGGNATVLLRSSLTSANFSLLDTGGHGVGVASVANLRYQGSGSVTLSGNTLNNYIQGGTGNDYLAGGGGADTLDASTSRGNATLIGNSNGRSTLEGGFGTNSFFLNNIIPDALYAQAGSHNNITSKFSLDLTASNLQYDSLVYTGSQAVTFTGDALGHTTLNAGIALSSTLSDGGGANDCMIGSSAGTNLFKVSSLATDSIQGGTPPTLAGAPRSNTLWSATAAQSVTDSAFSKISGVSILTLSGNDHLTLGSAAQSAGISTIIGNSISGNGSETINASAYTSGITIKVTDPLPSSHFLLQGGSGNDLFQEGYSNLGFSTISGGAGSDTLALSGAGLQSVSDSAFSSVSGVEVLSLTGNTDVTFGNNAYRTGKGFQTIYGGTGGDTFTQTSADPTALTLIGGASAANSFSIATHGELVSDSIVGGGAGDTLIAAYADTDINDLFSKVSRVSAVSLTSASAITLGSAAQSAGIHSVFGGAGGDTITQLSTNNNALAITGGSSAGNLFSIGSRSGLLADSIQGGGNGDTLSLAYADQGMSDAVFSNISGIEALQLSSRSAVTLDGNASGAGISTVYGGSGGDSITQLAGGPTALTVVGGTSPDLVVVGTWDQLLNDSLVGSGKGDTLALGFADTTDLSDTFGDISGINALQLTSSSSVTLGANAQAEQLNSIFGGAGGDTFVQSGDTNALTIVGGSGNDSITIDTNANFVTDSIIGGAGFDTLTLLESGDISDISFASVSGIEVLSLTSASAVTLGADAQAAGISTIISGAGQDTIFAQSFGAPLTVDVTSASPAAMIIGGAAPETYLVAQGALSASTIQGNRGADTLAIVGADPNITDASFALISGVSALSLTSSSSVILDSNAYNSGAGFQSIYGGAGGDTFIQTANDTNALTIVGGALGANSFAVGLRSELDADSLVGGNAGDTLTLAFADQNLNDPFARMSGIEALSLTSASAVTLGTAAFNEHLSAVYTGAGTGIGNTQGDTITQTAEDTLTMTLAGGAGDDLITVGSRSELLADSLVGNTGTNTLALSYADTALNDSFTRISGFQALQLTSSSAVTLGANASTAGIATVYGGSGSDSISQLSAGPGAVTLIGGTSADYFSVGSWSQLSSDSIVGSGVGDTLSLTFTDTTDLNDTFGNISGIAALQLTSASAVTLGGNASTEGIVSIFGGSGSGIGHSTGDTLTQISGNTSALTISGGTGNDSINVATWSQFSADSISGGAGINTLSLGFADSADLSDASFAKTSGVQVLQLTSSSAVTLGANAQSSGITTVFGGSGGDTFLQGIGDSLATTFVAGNLAPNTFSLSTRSQLNSDSIFGGGSGDLLSLGFADNNLSDQVFTRVSGVGALSLTSASAVSLGSHAASAGILVVLGGSGGDSISQLSTGPSSVTLLGGTSADYFSVASWSQLYADSIVGSNFGDTLSLGFADTTDLNDPLLNISGIGAIQLSSASAITLDVNAYNEGIASIFGGSGAGTGNTLGDTITQTANDTNALTLVGGTGNDFVSVATRAELLADSIAGGTGVDTLSLGFADTNLTDSIFTKVSGMEALSLSSASAITLGSGAMTAGVSTVITGTGSDTVVASSFSGPLVVDASASTVGTDIIGTSSSDLFLVNSTALSNSTISGGGGSDTLSLTQTGSIIDGDFARITGISAVSLTSATSIVLGNNAYRTGTGFSSIFGGIGNDTFTQTATDTKALTLVGSTSTLNGAGGDLFNIALLSELTADSIYGGVGVNTLTLQQSGILADTAFSKVSGIQALSITSASSLTLGSNAMKSGISTVYGGNGGDTFTQTAADTLASTIIGGGVTGNLFSIATKAQFLADSLVGGGNDTLSLNFADTNLNDPFNRLSTGGFKALQLTSRTAVTLNGNASNSGIATVYGGLGGDSISQLASAPSAMTLVGGTSADYFGVSSWSQLSSDSIIGSGRGDTLSLGFADTTHLNDSFGNIAGINALQLSSASAVTLGGNSALIGISSVYGGIGGDSFTHLASASQAVAFTGGFAGPNSYNISTISQLASDTIVGGHGNDTIFLGAAGNIADSSLAHVSGVAAIQLSSQSSITLGGNAASDHLASVFGGTGGDTFTQTVADTLATTLSGGSGGANSFIIANSSILANDSIRGGGAVDSLIITSASQTLTDSNFFRVSSVEILRTANGSNSVTVGTRAQNAGILTIIGGTGNDLINASAYTSNVSLNGGGSATSADTLTGSTGAGVDTFVLGTTATPFYGTTSAGTGAANYAVVNNFNGSDRLQLSSSQLGHYSLGALHDNSSRSSTAFGLYDNGKIVADVHTSGGFTLATNGTGDTNFLNPTNNHVTFV